MESRDSRIISNFTERLNMMSNKSCYAVDSTQTIYLTNIDVDFISIDFSSDGGLTYSTILTSAATTHYTSGSQEIYGIFQYNFLVPNQISNTCYLKVYDTNDEESVYFVSDRFSIANYNLTINNIVNQVIIPKKTLKINDYPAVILQWNENQIDEEYFQQEQSTLDVILIYVDGLNDDNDGVDSYQWRYRNVYADFKKAIMLDPSLNGECEYVKIESHAPMILQNGNDDIEAYVLYLSIIRTTDINNPYL